MLGIFQCIVHRWHSWNIQYPELYKHFQQGHFSVQLKQGNPFGRILVDQTTEETVNTDTQTAGDTTGFSLKPGAVSRYYLTAEYRASTLRQLCETVNIKSFTYSNHPDLMKKRIHKDEPDIAAIVDTLENDWTNPFDKDPSDLVNISTGVPATPEVCNDLLDALLKRRRGSLPSIPRASSRRWRILWHNKENQYGQAKTKGVKGTSGEVILKADRRLFGIMILIEKTTTTTTKTTESLTCMLCFATLLGPCHGPWLMRMELKKQTTTSAQWPASSRIVRTWHRKLLRTSRTVVTVILRVMTIETTSIIFTLSISIFMSTTKHYFKIVCNFWVYLSAWSLSHFFYIGYPFVWRVCIVWLVRYC